MVSCPKFLRTVKNTYFRSARHKNSHPQHLSQPGKTLKQKYIIPARDQNIILYQCSAHIMKDVQLIDKDLPGNMSENRCVWTYYTVIIQAPVLKEIGLRFVLC